MGILEIDTSAKIITISSNMICYGNAADYAISKHIAEEIEMMWNDPAGVVHILDTRFYVRFKINAQYNSLLSEVSVLENQNPRNNYIRIEEYSRQNISCMDAIGSNTGYFQRNNLYPGSTTAAHEYGHSLGLVHPKDLNIVGKGRPSIMYPRGTLVNQEFQNDVNAQPGGPGGTLDPQHRRVMQVDIDYLQLGTLIQNKSFVIGKFTNQYHEMQLKENNG